MGYMHALEFAEEMELEQGIRYQLLYNHFPPVPAEMIPIAIKAVRLCNDGQYDKLIKTPFKHREYGWNVPAHIIIKCYHLEPWIEMED